MDYEDALVWCILERLADLNLNTYKNLCVTQAYVSGPLSLIQNPGLNTYTSRLMYTPTVSSKPSLIEAYVSLPPNMRYHW
jgi:hypothetical protein